MSTPTGGISYYDFSEGTETTLGDVWNSNNGTINGAIWSTDVPNYAISGSPYRSLSFDGINDYVSIPDSLSNEPFLNDFSISCFFKTTSVNSMLITKYVVSSPYTQGYRVWLQSDGTLKVMFGDGDGNSAEAQSTGVVNDDNWHSLVITWDSNSKTVKQYIDNQEDGISINNNINSIDNNVDLMFGIRGDNKYDFDYTGLLTNVQIFNTVLTTTQISNLYNYGDVSGMTEPELAKINGVSLITNTVPTNGIAYYDFSEGTGTELSDSWGTNDGVIFGATWDSNVPNYATSGSPDYSLSFDGTNDYVSIPDNNDFDSISIAGTSCGWVYWTDNTQPGTIISKWYSGSGYGAWSFAIRGDNQKLQFETSGTGSDTILSINSIPQNEWTFVCFTFDSALSNNEGKIYINGILDNQKSMSGTIHTNNAEVRIGKKTHTGDYEFFKGQISNVQIFNTALTEEQIQNLYNYGNVNGA